MFGQNLFMFQSIIKQTHNCRPDLLAHTATELLARQTMKLFATEGRLGLITDDMVSRNAFQECERVLLLP